MKNIIPFLIVLLLVSPLVFAGGEKEEGAAAETATVTVQAKEAPALAQLVEQGELPPLDERLPSEPMVVEVDEIGVYGGDLQYPSTYTFAPDVLVRESLTLFPKGKHVAGPGLAKAWEVNEDATEFTFYLRQGLKWSDGEPYTVDDIMFWWNDLLHNDDYSAFGPPTWMKSGGDTKLEKIDDTTVKIIFAAPYALFAKVLAFRGVFEFEDIPAHYLKQFHPDYADADELEQLVQGADFESWDQLMDAKRNTMQNTELPTPNAWVLVQTWPDKRIVMERNPYYYKVDQEGHQLPYIDRFVSEFVSNAELARLKVLDGQTDFQYKFMGFTDFTMLKEGEDDGGYQVLRWPTGGAWVDMKFNQNIKDPQKRTLFHDVEFRKALSYAIDRDEMNDLLMFGVGLKSQPAGSPMDPYYEEGFGDTAIEYRPDLANEMLDGLGLDRKNSQGYRLLPNGEVLDLTIECYPRETGSAVIEFYSMVAEYWEAIGIKTAAKEIARELWTERALAGDVEIPGYTTVGVAWDINQNWYIPIEQNCWWAPLYGLWYSSGGSTGEEPTPIIKQLQDLGEQMRAETDPDKRLQIGTEVLRIHDENVWNVGILKVPFQPVIVNSRMRNYLEEGVQDYRHLHEAQTWPEQLFYVDGRRK